MEIKLKAGAEGNRRTITAHGESYMIFKGEYIEIPDHFANEINPEIYDIKGAPEKPKPTPTVEKKTEKRRIKARDLNFM